MDTNSGSERVYASIANVMVGKQKYQTVLLAFQRGRFYSFCSLGAFHLCHPPKKDPFSPVIRQTRTFEEFSVLFGHLKYLEERSAKWVT